MSNEDTTTARVSESKFNGVVSLVISGVEDRDTVGRVARHYFNDQYDHSPSKVVAQPQEGAVLQANSWEVMVADHSSGSLKPDTKYEI